MSRSAVRAEALLVLFSSIPSVNRAVFVSTTFTGSLEKVAQIHGWTLLLLMVHNVFWCDLQNRRRRLLHDRNDAFKYRNMAPSDVM